MWYKFSAFNSEAQYGWTTDAKVAEAACAWLNRKRETALYSVEPIGATDADAERLTGTRLQDYQGLLVTDESAVHDFPLAISVTSVTCLRCRHQWLPRSAQTPVRCPKCGSPYWNKPGRKVMLHSHAS